MGVTVNLPAALRQHTEAVGEVRLDAPVTTVGEALGELFRLHPELRDRIVGETGRLREHVNLFVGSESIRHTGGLDTPVPDGAEVTILPAVSGG